MKRAKREVRRVLSCLPTLLFFAAFCCGETPGTALLLVFSVLLHEGCHALAFLLMQTGTPTLRGADGGFLLSPGRPLSAKEEAVAAAAGPAGNLLAAALCLPFSPCGKGWFFAAATVNFLTAACNLVPIKGTDGGRLLAMGAAAAFGTRAGSAAAEGASLLLAGGAFFGSVFLFYHGEAGLSLPLFAAVTLFRATEDARPCGGRGAAGAGQRKNEDF